MITTLRRLTVAGALALAVVGLASCNPPPPTGPVRFNDAPIAAYRVNGVGYATLITGNTIYLGGSFTTVYDTGGATVASRANLAAFDKNTGVLIGAFRADTDGQVNALAYDGTNLYVGGLFTHVNGTSRSHLVAVDPISGAVRTGWSADTSTVNALAIGGGKVFVAGTFSSIKGVARNRVAAVSPVNGAVDPTFNPNANGTVLTIAAQKDGSTVYLGGEFTAVGGTSITRLVAVRGDTGAITSPTFARVTGKAMALQLDSTGAHLAAGLGDYANQGAWFDTTSGAKLWSQTCGGDGQAVATVGQTMFSGFHEECDSDYTIRLTSNSTTNGARDLTWKPSFDKFWGVRALATDGYTLAVAGDFTNVAGVAAQGLAIFEAAPPPPPPPVSMAMGSQWRYLVSPTEATGWTDPTYDDSAWPVGPAQLGFGDGDEATVIGYGPDASSKYITTWFRSTFNATAIPSTLTLNLVADDGAIVYVNGVEVARDNMPAGPDTASLLAASNRSGSAENAIRSFTIPPSAVQTGLNSIAVSVHQDWANSSDLSFDAGLTSTP